MRWSRIRSSFVVSGCGAAPQPGVAELLLGQSCRRLELIAAGAADPAGEAECRGPESSGVPDRCSAALPYLLTSLNILELAALLAERTAKLKELELLDGEAALLNIIIKQSENAKLQSYR